MALTDVTFNYNVAKVIDTPWNTIINGLNYTKTNLTPLALKYTLCNNYDCGMLLKEVAGNSVVQYCPIEDFSWNNAVIDYDNIDKYWILNTSHKTNSNSGPLIYSAKKYVDENGFEYSIIANAMPTLNGDRNCSQIWYQDSTYLFVYTNNIYYNSTGSAIIYRFYKNNDTEHLESKNTYSTSNGTCTLLDVKDGYIFYLKQYGTDNCTRQINKIEIATGIETTLGTFNSSGLGVLTSYPTNIVNEEFYLKNCVGNVWYKYSFLPERTSVTQSTISCDYDVSNFTGTSNLYVGQIKRFTHIYIEGDIRYLAVITLNSYSYDTNLIKSTIQLYEITEEGLKRKQELIVDGFSMVPKNDWNTLFIGTNSGLKVFNWDPLEKQFIEKQSIYTTVQEFGFDTDERLWIMDVEGNVFRYTYNQPLSVDYKFEKLRYEIGTDLIESYVDVRILNYMGEIITTKMLIKAIGNFTFENNLKEKEIQLTSTEYLRLPIYIKGTGKYEIRI